MYHGTRKSFSDPLVFDPNMSQIGIHLSDNPNGCKGFSGDVQTFSNPRVYALYADIRNPVTLPDLVQWTLDSLMYSLEKEMERNYPARHKQILKVHGSYETYFDTLAQQYSGVDYMALRRVDHMDSEFMQFILKDLGFDGVRYLNRYELRLICPHIPDGWMKLLTEYAATKNPKSTWRSTLVFQGVDDYATIKAHMKVQKSDKDGILGGRLAGRYQISDEVIREELREFARKYPEAIVMPDSYSYIAIDAKQLYSAVGDGRMTNEVNIAYSRGVGDVKALTTEQLQLCCQAGQALLRQEPDVSAGHSRVSASQVRGA